MTFSTAREKFEALVQAWDDFNSGRSVIKYDHPAYLQVIGMGPRAVPFLLERLRDEGDGDWIYAIKCISGEEAESVEMHGDPEKVIEAWLDWGRRNGHIESERQA